MGYSVQGADELAGVVESVMRSGGQRSSEHLCQTFGDVFAQKVVRARAVGGNLTGDHLVQNCPGGPNIRLGVHLSARVELLRRIVLATLQFLAAIQNETSFNMVFADIDQLDYIVTDRKPTKRWLKVAAKKNISLIYPET